MDSQNKPDFGQIDLLIRSGRGFEARELLKAAPLDRFSTRELCVYAGFCRRVSLYDEGLKALRDEYFRTRELQRPDAEVMAEYAALLSEIGATAIAGKILQRLEPLKGIALFYSALRHMKSWDYAQALEPLNEFIQSERDPYWLAIGNLNRLACLVVLQKFDEARILLEELKKDDSGLSELGRGSLLELEGQLYFYGGGLEQARRHFQSAHKSLSSSSNPAALFAEKWIYVCRLMDPIDTSVESDLKAFQERLLKSGQWEVLRDLDRFHARRTGRLDQLNKLYFGSPHEAYRKMVAGELGQPLPAVFSFRLGAQDGEAQGTLKLAQMEFEGPTSSFSKFPALSKRLLSALLRDLYRPVAIGTLFELLFPGEHFDLEFSRDKTHQVIKRFRALCAKHDLPLQVVSTDLGYKLQATAPLIVELTRPDRILKGEAPEINLLHLLEKEFQDLRFSVAEISDRVKVSPRTVSRRLTELQSQGFLESLGAGRSRTYRLKKRAA